MLTILYPSKCRAKEKWIFLRIIFVLGNVICTLALNQGFKYLGITHVPPKNKLSLLGKPRNSSLWRTVLKTPNTEYGDFNELPTAIFKYYLNIKTALVQAQAWSHSSTAECKVIKLLSQLHACSVTKSCLRPHGL